MVNLKVLGLNNNRLGCLPNNLDSLTSLQVLAICDQHDAFHVQHVIPFKSMPDLLRIDLRQRANWSALRSFQEWSNVDMTSVCSFFHRAGSA